MTYNFQAQFEQGQQGEDELDQFFSTWYAIDPVSIEVQKTGIDRVFTRLDSKVSLTVEYKSDRTASRTGNAFVELVSVANEHENKPGWARSSQAQYLIYYLPDDRLVYVIRMAQLRSRLDSWGMAFSTRRIPNRGYDSVGLLVPLDQFERIAIDVLSL